MTHLVLYDAYDERDPVEADLAAQLAAAGVEASGGPPAFEPDEVSSSGRGD